MKRGLLSILLPLIALLLIPTQTAGAQEKSYSAASFTSEVVVEEGGSILVTETILFDFVGGPFTFVFRHLPTDLTDGIDIIETSVDGRVYPVGDRTGQASIEEGNPLEIEWNLEPTQNRQRSFQIIYRVNGVVRQEADADLLLWQPLPDSYEYVIDRSETIITSPSNVEVVIDPLVDTGQAAVERRGNDIIFTTGRLEPNSPLIVGVGFEPGKLITSPPAWQVRNGANQARLPYFIGGAIVTLLAGIAGIGSVASRNFLSTSTYDTRPDRPDDLPAGLAGALVAGGSPSWQTAQGTLFQLADEEVVIIEELDEKKWWEKHAFGIKQVDFQTRTIEHEEELLDLLFTKDGKRSTALQFNEMPGKITGKGWKAYQEGIESALRNAGYLDAARQAVRTQLFTFGAILAAVGFALFFLAAFFVDQYGGGPFLVGGTIAGLGLIALTAGSAITPLSKLGVETAVEWTKFKNYISYVSRGKLPIENPSHFEKYLPYAATFGLIEGWSKRFEKEGWTDLPSYFQLLPTTSQSQGWASYMAMNSAFNASGGSAGGAGGAGAGAAGGGASGAG